MTGEEQTIIIQVQQITWYFKCELQYKYLYLLKTAIFCLSLFSNVSPSSSSALSTGASDKLFYISQAPYRMYHWDANISPCSKAVKSFLSLSSSIPCFTWIYLNVFLYCNITKIWSLSFSDLCDQMSLYPSHIQNI